MSRDIIKLDQIDVTFHQKKRTITAVKDVTIHIQEGDIYGIVGYSGAGKSTLVRVINLLQKPSAGKITIDNDVIFDGKVTLTAEQLRRKRQDIGMIFQHFNLMSQKTAEENVAFALKHSGLSKEEKKAKVAKLLDLVGLADRAENYPSQLSGGQKQRVAIARALANDPKILIIDEPTAGLDPEERLRFYNLLSELAVERIILLSTHIASDIEATCSKAAVLSSGTVVFEGQIEKLLQLGNGKVYTTTILQNELNQFKQKYRVISIYQNGINVSCRFLSNAAPKKEWVSCQPTIEDSYMYLLSSFKQEVE